MQRRITSMVLLVALLVTLVGVIPVASQDRPSSGELNIVPTDPSVEPFEDITIEPRTVGKEAVPAAKEPARMPQGLDLEADVIGIIVELDDSADPVALESVPGAKIIYRYENVLNGVSMALPGNRVVDVAAMPGVKALFRDELNQLHTETTPQFTGADAAWSDLGGPEDAGEGIVVGVIDTGIWPEHPSFADDGTLPVPPGGLYPCEFGSAVPGDDPFVCNDKLIGAYRFLDTYDTYQTLLPGEFLSARDDNGHGTHTASTAAGNYDVAASLLGVPRGQVSGMAPRAHVIMYKACGDAGCYDSDTIAAIDQAVADGVDVINYSIGGGSSNPFDDAGALAFLDAFDAGVFVATSAGNDGPGADTLGSPGNAPWITTVGASTSDRHFISTITVGSSLTTTVLTLEGASVTDGIAVPTALVFPPAGEELCLDPFTSGTFAGEIVVCERGTIARVEKSYNVAEGGAGGLILYNPTLQGLATDNHFIPSVHVENDTGAALVAYMNEFADAQATFTPGVATAVPGDKMAAFSSRGGVGDFSIVAKPDVTAPGVQILAGHSPMAATVEGGLPGELFQSIQGTSMSSPHVAGFGALLKDMHPDWSVGMIKSALMTTATPNVVKEDGTTPADAWDMGAGRTDLAVAGDATFFFDSTADDFWAHQGDPWNANYPSLYVPNMPNTIVVQRKALLVPRMESAARYFATDWDYGVEYKDKNLQVEVNLVDVEKSFEGTYFSFDIYIKAYKVPLGEVRFAGLYFTNTDTGEYHRFPIVISRHEPVVTLDKTCTPKRQAVGEWVTCTITAENTGLEPAKVKIVDLVPTKIQVPDETYVAGARFIPPRKVRKNTILDPMIPGLRLIEGDYPYAGNGFMSMGALGASPVPPPSNPDDGGYLLPVSFVYQGTHYTDAIWSVNGTLQLGIGAGEAAHAGNVTLPDVADPNNILAPWWNDLDLTLGGNWYWVGIGPYDVWSWEDVPRFDDPSTTVNFQIWIEYGTDKAWFVYGDLDGPGLDATIGVENIDGTLGDTYYNGDAGIGSLPPLSLLVDQNSGTPGETHTITFEAIRATEGTWKNCARMTGDTFVGTHWACFKGKDPKLP